jgi:hypothetical protein
MLIRRNRKQTKGDRFSTILWSVKIAHSINKRVFWLWLQLSTLIAILPAISLYFYKELVSLLSIYINTGEGTFLNSIPSILALSFVLILSGFSGRINGDLLYMAMYDYYHLGLQEMIMNCVQQVEVKTLLSKENFDEYKAVLNRAGSLTDFMSAACLLICKIIGIISLLLVTINISLFIFSVAFVYIVMVIYVNIKLADKARLDMLKIKEVERRIDYFDKIVLVPCFFRTFVYIMLHFAIILDLVIWII